MKKTVFAAALLGSAIVSAPAYADPGLDLTGSTATATLLYPDATVYAGPATAIVGAGTEFVGGTFSPAPQSIDIGARSISLFTNGAATYSTAGFNGFQIDFSNYSGSLGALRVLSSSSFQPVGFEVVGNAVRINLSGQTVGANDFLSIGVPEPSTWALMILGFGAVGYSMRRRGQVRTTVTYA